MSRTKAFIKRVVPRPILRRLIRIALHPQVLRIWNAGFRRRLQVHHIVAAATGGVVASGPFAGMRYVQASQGSAYTPKLLGTYEKELWPLVEQVGRAGYDSIIDIGAAEGYYAVGLARLAPEARITAFELEQRRHHLLLRMAQLNGVAGQIELLGACTPPLLAERLAAARRPLVVCDVEGFEEHLLDPLAVPALARADLLVELHERQSEGITQLLRRRFEPTHALRLIHSEERKRTDWPAGLAVPPELSEQDLLLAVSEFRGEPMAWYWMQVRPPTADRGPGA